MQHDKVSQPCHDTVSQVSYVDQNDEALRKLNLQMYKDTNLPEDMVCINRLHNANNG